MPASFTVAIPTHNRRDTVVLALQSALEQTRPAVQVIVLCDGCRDGTQRAVAALGDRRVEVIDLPKGPGYAYAHRTRALERARGEAIVWLGDDDLLLPDHLENIGALWDTHRVDLVQTYAVLVAPDDTVEWLGADWSVPHYRAIVLDVENTTPMGAVCVGVRAARDAGGWDGTLDRRADWDLWKRMLRAGARTLSTDSATLLHFRASGRTQPWPERVAQNRSWLERIRNPAQLKAMRAQIAHLRAEREGDYDSRIRGLWAENQYLHKLAAEAGLTA